MKLIIGNKRYSSWSLRPWLLMKQFEIAFEEILIPLDQPQSTEQILKYSPSAKVPALIDKDLNIWDSLAIAEYLNEQFPDKQMWPKDVKQRALARAISCEMHSSFQDLRQHLSHDLKKEYKENEFDYSVAKKDIERIKQIWTQCLKESQKRHPIGPYLFGDFSVADAMFAPVVNRFVTYAVPVKDEVAQYVQTIRKNKAHQLWIEQAMSEELRVPRKDFSFI